MVGDESFMSFFRKGTSQVSGFLSKHLDGLIHPNGKMFRETSLNRRRPHARSLWRFNRYGRKIDRKARQPGIQDAMSGHFDDKGRATLTITKGLNTPFNLVFPDPNRELSLSELEVLAR